MEIEQGLLEKKLLRSVEWKRFPSSVRQTIGRFAASQVRRGSSETEFFLRAIVDSSLRKRNDVFTPNKVANDLYKRSEKLSRAGCHEAALDLDLLGAALYSLQNQANKNNPIQPVKF